VGAGKSGKREVVEAGVTNGKPLATYAEIMKGVLSSLGIKYKHSF
jgi:hypothetical protein